MAFEVGILIKSQAQLQAPAQAEAAIERIGETAKRVNAESARLPAAIRPVAPAVQQVTDKAQGMSTVFSVVGSQVAGLGPSAGVAGQALQSLVNIGINPVTIGMTALAGILAIVISRINEARERMRELAERELKALTRETDNLKLDQTLRLQIQAARALDPELEQVRQKYELLRIEAEKSGASQATLGRVATLQALEEKKIKDQRLEQATKEAEVRQKELNDLALKNELLRQEAALGQIQTGRTALQDFQQQFGVSLGVDKEAGLKLATQFVSVFNAFKDDPAAQKGLNQAFAALVQQAIDLGLPDIPELLTSVGLTEKDFASLKQTIGGDLQSGLDQSREAGQQWGAAFDAELAKIIERAGQVGGELQALDQRIQGITKEVAWTMDVQQPLSAIDEVKARIDGIPDVVRKTIIIDTVQGAGGGLAGLEETFGRTTGLQFGSRVFN